MSGKSGEEDGDEGEKERVSGSGRKEGPAFILKDWVFIFRFHPGRIEADVTSSVRSVLRLRAFDT